MIEEFYLTYYDDKGRRHYSVYYTDERTAKQVALNLEEQGYKDVKIETFRY